MLLPAKALERSTREAHPFQTHIAFFCAVFMPVESILSASVYYAAKLRGLLCTTVFLNLIFLMCCKH